MREEKAIVLDIDGTLTNSRKEISAATKHAIRGLLEKGHKVILASGRPTPGMRRYEEELELERYGGYLLSFNGARIVECRTGRIVYQRLLPSAIVPGLYGFARRNGCGLVTYLGSEVISAFPPDEYVELESHINGMPVREVSDFPEFVDFDVNKCLMTAEPGKAELLEKELQEKYEGSISVYRSEPFFLEVMPKDVNKATSLERVLPAIGVRRENTVCCGDGFNDIPMLRYAGVGVAMGNAWQAVKDSADYITATNDEDGLVQVIREFFAC